MLMEGRNLLNAGRHGEAVARFSSVLSLDRDATDAYMGLCLGHTALGNKNEALSAVMNLIRIRPSPESRRFFLEFLCANEPLPYAPGMEEALMQCLRVPEMAGRAGPHAVFQIYHKYALGRPNENLATIGNDFLYAFLADDLFLDVMANSIIRNWRVEQLLTSVRKRLIQSRKRVSFNQQTRKICICYAYQCINNDYAYYQSEEEKSEVRILQDEIGQNLVATCDNPPGLEPAFLIWMMYAPLYHHPARENLLKIAIDDWSPDVRNLITRTLFNKEKERVLQSRLPTLGPVGNDISRRVQQQYEAFPYPQWIHVGGAYPDTRQRLTLINRDFELPAYLDGPVDILIAGAGTGQHPIKVAMSDTRNHVTALDLSGASLAYGARMAEELGLHNIDFMQGDILDVERIGKNFDIIQCSGVLHHMQDPILGWSKLVSVLRDKGLMKIALYSETARRGLIPAWDRIKALGLGDSADEIRKFRHEVIESVAGGRDSEIANVLNVADFYILSDCRDLLFNVHEIRFTIPAIKSALSQLGLTFIGMEGDVPTATLAKLKQAGRLPANASVRDLDMWETLEQQAPDTFAQMYQLWCIK
jgi:SAM-dependent methyltransferase